jgi:hypothetical protein
MVLVSCHSSQMWQTEVHVSIEMEIIFISGLLFSSFITGQEVNVSWFNSTFNNMDGQTWNM